MKMRLFYTWLVLIASICSSCSSTQKVLYKKFSIYNNALLDSIEESWYKSEYLFRGKIKSVNIKSGLNESNASQTLFYTKDRKNLKRVGFDSNMNIISETIVYGELPIWNKSIIKTGFDSSKNLKITSEHDQKKKLIVVKKERKTGELLSIEVDSIIYSDHYYPILTKSFQHYNNKNHLKSIEKIEYVGNQVLLQMYERDDGYQQGEKRFYDSENRFLYSRRLTEINITESKYQVGELEKEWPVFKWNDNNYEKVNKFNDTTRFDFESRTLITYSNRHFERRYTYFTQDFRPILKETKSQPSNKNSEQVEFSYNEYNDLISEKYKSVRYPNSDSETRYEYEYDKKGNWILRKKFIDEELRNIIRRKIEYY